ncbi:MAG TPA: type II secretion system F family protein [Propionibacteriaceae bacterium]|nr:type II secretion system F family protein [Propionibacteriaceae bacterium]
MTDVLVLCAAMATVWVVWLVWPDDRLRRLAEPPRLVWPAWLRPRPSSPPPRVRAVAGAGAGLVVALFAGGPPLVQLAALGSVGAAVYGALGRLEGSRTAADRADLVAALPGALDLLSACVAAGMPLRGAAAAVAGVLGGGVGDRLGQVVARTAAGFGDADAWAVLRDDSVLGAVARDLSRASDAGTAMGPLLARHAEAARATAQAEALARARAVGVRTIIPVSLCYLPAFFLLGVVPVIAGVLAAFVR